MDTRDHFKHLNDEWDRLQLPFRARHPIAANMDRCLPAARSPMLVLGATPEFATLAEHTIAVDNAPDRLDALWPTGPRAEARLGDWKALPLAQSSMATVVGDFCLTLARFEDETTQVLSEVSRILRPGGVAVLRVSPCPDRQITDDEVRAYPSRYPAFGPDGLRLLLALQTAQRLNRATVTGAEIWDNYQRLRTDLEIEMTQTDWHSRDRDRLTLYENSTLEMNFPALGDLLDVAGRYFRHTECRPSGPYPLSEDLPLLCLNDPR